MNEHVTNTLWQEGMAFENTVDGHSFVVDAAAEFGGEDKGPRPKNLLLTALAGCTAMDVVSVLRKMKQDFTWFNVKVAGILSDEHPKIFESIRLTYQFKKSDSLDDAKVRKAASLSQERYCGVSAMLRKSSDVSWDVEYLD